MPRRRAGPRSDPRHAGVSGTIVLSVGSTTGPSMGQTSSVRQPHSAALTSSTDHSKAVSQNNLPSLTMAPVSVIRR